MATSEVPSDSNPGLNRRRRQTFTTIVTLRSIPTQLHPGFKVGDLSLKTKIGSGGNGQVWIAENASGTKVAIKILTKQKPVAYARFCDEVKILRENGDIGGLLPVINSGLPDLASIGETPAWFSMPIGERLKDHISTLSIIKRVEPFVHLSQTLAELHRRGIAHRDIKPSNLLWFDGRACFCDFGLANYEGKADLTGVKENIGPIWTMAPEVRRLGTDADPFCADVYSLAKSLWIAITGEEKGFDGQYSPVGTLSIRVLTREKPEDQQRYWGELDSILSDSTEHAPERRPTITQFNQRLTRWLEVAHNWDQSSTLTWRSTQKKIFPIAVPARATWNAINDIVRVLESIGTESMNHMFYPSGGGSDFTYAKLAAPSEPGCIELQCDEDISIAKPKLLAFESFGSESEWNYFRLDLSPLLPFAETRYTDGRTHEYWAEIPGYGYIDASCFELEEFNGAPLPRETRQVYRFLSGSFVFFQKSSMYNTHLRISGFDVYDAPHSKMTAAEFRKLVAMLARRYPNGAD